MTFIQIFVDCSKAAFLLSFTIIVGFLSLSSMPSFWKIYMCVCMGMGEGGREVRVYISTGLLKVAT